MFDLGQQVMTSGFASLFRDDAVARETAQAIIGRHRRGDWGELGYDDRAINDQAVASGDDFLLSKYTIAGEAVYVITDFDQSTTTVLLAADF